MYTRGQKPILLTPKNQLSFARTGAGSPRAFAERRGGIFEEITEFRLQLMAKMAIASPSVRANPPLSEHSPSTHLNQPKIKPDQTQSDSIRPNQTWSPPSTWEQGVGIRSGFDSLDKEPRRAPARVLPPHARGFLDPDLPEKSRPLTPPNEAAAGA